MSTPDAFDRIATAWLADGPNELADRVLEATLAEVSTTTQRRPVRAPGRTTFMSAAQRFAAAVAIVAVVGLAGFYLIGRNGSVAAPPTAGPTATATASPATASPIATSVPSYPPLGTPDPTTPVPAALRGTWESVQTPGQYMALTDHGYAFFTTPNDKATGLIAGDDTHLYFLNSSSGSCDVHSVYTWTLSSPTDLRTTVVGSDACPRGEFMSNGEFHLVSR